MCVCVCVCVFFFLSFFFFNCYRDWLLWICQCIPMRLYLTSKPPSFVRAYQIPHLVGMCDTTVKALLAEAWLCHQQRNINALLKLCTIGQSYYPPMDGKWLKNLSTSEIIVVIWGVIANVYALDGEVWQTTVQFSCSVVSHSLWHHEPQHARPLCPSPTPGVHPNPCPSSR